MKLASVVIGLLSISLYYVGAQHWDDFRDVHGCRLFRTDMEPDDPLYFPTADLVNVVDTGLTKYFRMGVLGLSDAVVRYGAFPQPELNRDVVEIVFQQWDTEFTIGRLQRRLLGGVVNKDLAMVYTPNLLSPFRPLMMVLRVSRTGRVDVFLEGENYPLLTFLDPQRTPPTFMAFTKYQRDLVFFYDCPMREPRFLEFKTLTNTTAQP